MKLHDVLDTLSRSRRLVLEQTAAMAVETLPGSETWTCGTRGEDVWWLMLLVEGRPAGLVALSLGGKLVVHSGRRLWAWARRLLPAEGFILVGKRPIERILP